MKVDALQCDALSHSALVSHLAALVAHDLRNPLTGAMTTVELLEMRLPKEERYQECIERIQGELTRIQQRIFHFVSYTETLEAPTESSDLVQLLNHFVELHGKVFQDAGGTLKFENSMSTCIVPGGEELLLQVIGAVTAALAEYSPSSGVKIEYELRSTGEESAQLRITSCTAAEEEVERIGGEFGVRLATAILRSCHMRLEIEKDSAGGVACSIEIPYLHDRG